MKSIALTMIVKNEARSLARCLQSVKPWVDQMIVLDTGSTDGTMEIAREHGALVFQQPWPDDFSKARNAALAHSNADWNLVLDADEWIVSGGEYLTALKQDTRQCVHAIRIENYLGNDQNILTSACFIDRILPKGIRYVGRIHEAPYYKLPREISSIILAHDGYMEAQQNIKRGRNTRLLQQQLEHEPDNAYYLFHLGTEHAIDKDYAKALPYFKRACQLTPNHSSWRHELVVRTLISMKEVGDIEAAMIMASDEMPQWQDSPDFLLEVGSILLEQMLRHPEQGSELFPMIEHCWQTAISIGESTQRNGSISGSGSFIAAERLAALYQARKQHDKAQALHTLSQRSYQDFQQTIRW